MEPLGVVAILLGIFVAGARAPLIFAPRATLGVYAGLVQTDLRVRLLGLWVAGFGLALVLLGRDATETPAQVLVMIGWFLLLVGVPFLLLFPSFYRGIAGSILGLMRDSTDPAVLRGSGIVGVGVGLLLVTLGVQVL